MSVYFTGICGELGSNLAKIALDMGFSVSGNDLVRIKEAWRLRELNIMDQVRFLWKETRDLTEKDLEGTEILIDCGCYADRPFGENSPKAVLQNNLVAPQRLLEIAKTLDEKPVMIYPSSFVIFFGVPPSRQPLTEETSPAPKGTYALSKFYAEELYRCYHRTYDVPSMITRVGSCFASMGRTDQMVHRVIIEMLEKKPTVDLWSPQAGRAYTYGKDALNFYRLLLEKVRSDRAPIMKTLHNAGNVENKPYRNVEVVKEIAKLTGYEGSISLVNEYESTELVYDPAEGKEIPVTQRTDWKNGLTYKLLGWSPQYTLEEGLRETVEWFAERGPWRGFF